MGVNGVENEKEALDEAFSLLPDSNTDNKRMLLTNDDNENRLFEHGCDAIQKTIEEEFHEKLR